MSPIERVADKLTEAISDAVGVSFSPHTEWEIRRLLCEFATVVIEEARRSPAPQEET